MIHNNNRWIGVIVFHHERNYILYNPRIRHSQSVMFSLLTDIDIISKTNNSLYSYLNISYYDRNLLYN